jgi:predicted ATPase/class 3 adenylate cyclase
MTPMRSDLPVGTVTFLFTDVEGSTRLLKELGAEAYAQALADHRRALRETLARHGGVEVDTQGDAFFHAFPTAPGALQAAEEGQQALHEGPIRVRMGLHTGTPHVTEEGYVGEDVHLAARIAASAHGGQVVCSKVTRALVEDELTDLGEHRLKDIEEAVWIYQLGSERFPPLKTISNTNLPRPASSFVGRERETQEVVSLIGDGARLVTLSGPGGSGKTRLAIKAASELVPEFKSGVFWIGLAALRDPTLVADTITQTLGAKDGLEAHIAERELLLLLDNLEQLIDYAPALASLVEACPNLCVLVTSRERLRVRGEVEYAVPPLAEPEAVELFCQRSRLEADETVAELCRRLDNLPLAVELAAGRTSVLSPAQILVRLSQRLDLLKGGRDAEARQQTLRATIEWSYDLLSEDEKQLFGRLSVFAGGCTPEAAEEVADADLDTLQSLVDKSLLRFTNERYWMLETIREYAAEQLAESREAEAVHRRHAQRFLALAEQAEPALRGERQAVWLQRLSDEHDNFRTGLAWLQRSGESESELRLVGALWRFWDRRGLLSEGRDRLGAALAADSGRLPHVRVKVLYGASRLAHLQGDEERAEALVHEQLDLCRALGDRQGLADCLRGVGNTAGARGKYDEAIRAFSESADLAREVGDTRGLAMSVHNLGYWSSFLRAHYDDAAQRFEESLALGRKLSDTDLIATNLWGLGMASLDRGWRAKALTLLREGLTLFYELRDKEGATRCLEELARVAAQEGKPDVAATLLAASEAIYEETGLVIDPTIRRRRERTVAMVGASLPQSPRTEAWARGRAMTLDDAVAYALKGGHA